jgi:hypothetical protein
VLSRPLARYPGCRPANRDAATWALRAATHGDDADDAGLLHGLIDLLQPKDSAKAKIADPAVECGEALHSGRGPQLLRSQSGIAFGDLARTRTRGLAGELLATGPVKMAAEGLWLQWWQEESGLWSACAERSGESPGGRSPIGFAGACCWSRPHSRAVVGLHHERVGVSEPWRGLLVAILPCRHAAAARGSAHAAPRAVSARAQPLWPV